MAYPIRLQFSATAEDYGEVLHKMMAACALTETLLSRPDVRNHFAILRASADKKKREIVWYQRKSSHFVKALFGCEIPWLEKLLAPAMAHNVCQIGMTPTPPSHGEPPAFPHLDGLSVAERKERKRKYKVACKDYEAQAAKVGRMPQAKSEDAFSRFAYWYVRHVLERASIKRLVEDEIYPDDYDPSGRREVQYGIDRITDLLSLPPRPNRRK